MDIPRGTSVPAWAYLNVTVSSESCLPICCAKRMNPQLSDTWDPASVNASIGKRLIAPYNTLLED
jgi:hypothetical protein